MFTAILALLVNLHLPTSPPERRAVSVRGSVFQGTCRVRLDVTTGPVTLKALWALDARANTSSFNPDRLNLAQADGGAAPLVGLG